MKPFDEYFERVAQNSPKVLEEWAEEFNGVRIKFDGYGLAGYVGRNFLSSITLEDVLRIPYYFDTKGIHITETVTIIRCNNGEHYPEFGYAITSDRRSCAARTLGNQDRMRALLSGIEEAFTIRKLQLLGI